MDENKVTLEEVEALILARDTDGLAAAHKNHYVGSVAVRERAGRALLELDRAKAIAALVQGLGPENTHPLSRNLLGEVGTGAFDTLVALSTSEDFKYRHRELAQAFSAIADARGVDVLLARLEAPGEVSIGYSEMEAIMTAFAQFRDARCYEPALKVLQGKTSPCWFNQDTFFRARNAAAKALAALGREEAIFSILDYVISEVRVGDVSGGVEALCELLRQHPSRIPDCMPQLKTLPVHQDFSKHYDGKMRHLDPYPSHGDEYSHTDCGVRDLAPMLIALPRHM